MTRSGVRLVVGAVVGLAVLSGPGSGPAAADPDPPYRGPTSVPGAAEVESSVARFQVEGSVTQFAVEASVTVFSVEGSVTLPQEEKTTTKEIVVTINSDVLFEFGKATLTHDAGTEIGKVAHRLPQGGTVKVDGYTDSVGTDAANLVLSRQRAQVVAAQLRRVRPDIKPVATGHGEADPVEPNSSGGQDNPAGRAKNRRVVTAFGR
jgi:OmpA-OmpF porin, OOP family